MSAAEFMTPEQIVDSLGIDWESSYTPSRDDVVRGIMADRAQRNENTLTIHLDEEWGPREAVREVGGWLALGPYTSGYEPRWELNDSYDRDGDPETATSVEQRWLDGHDPEDTVEDARNYLRGTVCDCCGVDFADPEPEVEK